MGGKIYGWKLIKNKMGRVYLIKNKSSIWPSTNDFASYGQSPMLISSVVFTWLTNKKKKLFSLYTSMCNYIYIGQRGKYLGLLAIILLVSRPEIASSNPAKVSILFQGAKALGTSPPGMGDFKCGLRVWKLSISSNNLIYAKIGLRVTFNPAYSRLSNILVHT